MKPTVVAVHLDAQHRFSKEPASRIALKEGLGVVGDAHSGARVQHRSRVRANPDQPNLRQVHLIHAELFEELAAKGFQVSPGALGENVTTRGLDLLGLSRGAVLRIGPNVRVEITGLRNPCRQIDAFQPGLMQAVLDRDAEGGLIRKAGVMGIVLAGGEIAPGDAIVVDPPEGPAVALGPV